MLCIRCSNNNFEHIPSNVIDAEDCFVRHLPVNPDEIPGPNLKCQGCNLVFVNNGSSLEIESDYRPAA